MALKKDTEAIIKKLNKQQPVVYSLAWELMMAVIAIVIDHLFDQENVDPSIWKIVIGIGVIPPIIIIGGKIITFIVSSINNLKGNYSVRHYIDLFDNQICYWVMTSNSYAKILQNIKDDNNSEKKFFYQEGCYYNNKAIHLLSEMSPYIDKIFCDDSQGIKSESLVDVYRLQSLIEVMMQQQAELDSNVKDITEDLAIQKQKELNSQFRGEIKDLLDNINEYFKTNIVWRSYD